MTSKKTGFVHIYKTPVLENEKWVIVKHYGIDIGAIYISDTKEEADSKLKKLLLLNMSITEDRVFEFEHEKEFFYLTIPQPDKATGTYSFSIKRMNTKETVKFFDDFETITQALQNQKKICGIFPEPPKEKVKVKRVGYPKKKATQIKKDVDLNMKDQVEAYVFIRSSMLQGLSKLTCFELLKEQHPQLSNENCESLHLSAIEYFRTNIVDNSDIPHIIKTHVEKYEKIYNYFYDVGNVQGMNRALALKEKLLGFHRKETILEFNQENNININKPQYVVSVLDDNEKNRLNSYLSKIVDNGDK